MPNMGVPVNPEARLVSHYEVDRVQGERGSHHARTCIDPQLTGYPLVFEDLNSTRPEKRFLYQKKSFFSHFFS